MQCSITTKRGQCSQVPKPTCFLLHEERDKDRCDSKHYHKLKLSKKCKKDNKAGRGVYQR